MNNTYKEIWNEFSKHKKFTICTHTNPDGDTIGTAVSLKNLLKLNLENVEVKISGDLAPANLKFIDETEKVSDDFFNNSQVIVVDTSNSDRIWDKRVITEKAIKLDHHPYQENWKMEIGGDNWAACGEHIFNLIKELGLKYNNKILDSIFVSIWTDTSGMKFREITNNTREAYEFSKINKDKIIQELEENPVIKNAISKTKKYIKIDNNLTTVFIDDFSIDNDVYRAVIDSILKDLSTEILIVCFKQSDGTYRSSIRSKGNFDAGSFARVHGGGGHFSSAGLKCKSISEANQISLLVKDMF